MTADHAGPGDTRDALAERLCSLNQTRDHLNATDDYPCSTCRREAAGYDPEQVQARLRDLTRRLGFGDNITEPQADNDTIIRWSEERDAEAQEWREHQLWLNDCAEAGCDPMEDCPIHAPACHPAHPDAGQEVAARVEAVLANWEDAEAAWLQVYGPQKLSVSFAVNAIRAALTGAAVEDGV